MAERIEERGVVTRVGIYIREDTRQALRRISFEEERSMTELVNEAIGQWLKKKNGKKT